MESRSRLLWRVFVKPCRSVCVDYCKISLDGEQSFEVGVANRLFGRRADISIPIESIGHWISPTNPHHSGHHSGHEFGSTSGQHPGPDPPVMISGRMSPSFPTTHEPLRCEEILQRTESSHPKSDSRSQCTNVGRA